MHCAFLVRVWSFVPSLLLIPVLLWIPGCQGAASTDKIDEPSRARLDGIPQEETVVLACRMKSMPESLNLGETGRELVRGTEALLVEMRREAMDAFLQRPEIQHAAVWGGSGAVAKMDHWLQAQTLNSWAMSEPVPLSCMARFKPGTTGLKERLEALGANPRTVAGIVVTLDAVPDALLRIVEMPELETVNQPRRLKPLGGN
jgi:hypothetical protein